MYFRQKLVVIFSNRHRGELVKVIQDPYNVIYVAVTSLVFEVSAMITANI